MLDTVVDSGKDEDGKLDTVGDSGKDEDGKRRGRW